MKKSNQNITVLFGGLSSEKEISIKSAMEIIPVLSNKYRVDLVELNFSNFSNFVNQIKYGSLVFNALHGGEGENGQIQAFLSQHGILYTGSGQMASMLAMNKHYSKIIASYKNISTPEWICFDINNIDAKKINATKKINYPVVVKPNFQGSTLGLTIVQNKNDLKNAIKTASKFSDEIIIEKFILGRELTVGILGNRVLDIVEIVPTNGFYDYKSKYTKGASKYYSPAKLDKKISDVIKTNALNIYKSLGCRHYSRVDFILENESKPQFLELNTLPGLSSTSLLPMSAKSKGINFADLIDTIVKISLVDNKIPA